MTEQPFVMPVRLRNLIWVPVLTTIVAAALVFGTPHLRFKYIWNGDERHPVYFECDYVGLHSFTLTPADGKCPVITLAHAPKGRAT